MYIKFPPLDTKQIFYCKRWNRLQKKMYGEMTFSQIKKWDAEGNYYYVLIGDKKLPQIILEISNKTKSINVVFVKYHDTPVQGYDVQQVFRYSSKHSTKGNNNLFLFECIFDSYLSKEENICYTESFYFKPDGTIKRWHYDQVERVRYLREGKGDVSKNWKEWPKLGEYDHLLDKSHVDYDFLKDAPVKDTFPA